MKPEDSLHISAAEYKKLAKTAKKAKKKMTWFELWEQWAHKFTKPEEILAIKVSYWLHKNHPDLLWWHTPNEGKRGIWQQVLAKLLGIKEGVLDIFIPLPKPKPAKPLYLTKECMDTISALWSEKQYSECLEVKLFHEDPKIVYAIPYHGFFCELKAGKNKPTQTQKDMMQRLTELGYYCCVCYTLDEFIKEWEQYCG